VEEGVRKVKVKRSSPMTLTRTRSGEGQEAPRDAPLGAAAPGVVPAEGPGPVAPQEEGVDVPLVREVAAKAIVLLPHQEALRQRALRDDIQWPMYLIWEMGSGKTFGALALLYALPSGGRTPRVLVTCPLSLVGQWRHQIHRFMTRCASPPRAKITVAHYEQIDRGEVVPRRFDLTVVDEAARFRNAFKTEADEEGRRPEVLHYEIMRILECARVLYLSGTPILASPEVERRAFDTMMRASAAHPPLRRVSVYDPREDPDFMKRFATRRDVVVHVPMLWSQTLLYFVFKRRPCRLRVDGDALVADVETGNSFETQLLKIANNPFTAPKFAEDEPESSPKIAALVAKVEALLDDERKQLVYSCRKGEGVEQIRFLLVARALERAHGEAVSWRDVAATRAKSSPLRAPLARAARELLRQQFLLLSGDMSAEERFEVVRTFNQPMGKFRKRRVLHFTQAAANGVDLNEAGDIHLLEPNLIKAMEDQVVARGLRLYAHRKGSKHTFGCYSYVATFPAFATLADDVDEDAVRDVLGFFRQYRRGGADELSRAQLVAICAALHEQHVRPEGATIDERHLRDARERGVLVRREVEKLRDLDPDGREALGKKQRAGWARRAAEMMRELKRADADARSAMSGGAPDGGPLAEPSAHGWDGASRCAMAARFMRDWWTRYEGEAFPGMFDRAWRNVRYRMSRQGVPLPPLEGAEAEALRADVREELRLLAARKPDTLRDRRFYTQIVSRELSRAEVDAFKRAVVAMGYARATADERGWEWSSDEHTYKLLPRPGQRGHAELMERFETECMTAPCKAPRPRPSRPPRPARLAPAAPRAPRARRARVHRARRARAPRARPPSGRAHRTRKKLSPSW
jgi:hypothetical protein